MSIGRSDIGKIPTGKPPISASVEITQQLGDHRQPPGYDIGTRLPDPERMSNRELSILLITTSRDPSPRSYIQSFSDPPYNPTLGDVIKDRLRELYRK